MAPSVGRGGSNPRRSNGWARSKQRARFKALGLPCGICKGARGPIRYDQPSNHEYPLSFVIDEKVPVSRWREYGYPSAKACALDPNNQRPAHWICNAQRGNKMNWKIKPGSTPLENDFPTSQIF